jgi:hypothetical protein
MDSAVAGLTGPGVDLTSTEPADAATTSPQDPEAASDPSSTDAADLSAAATDGSGPAPPRATGPDGAADVTASDGEPSTQVADGRLTTVLVSAALASASLALLFPYARRRLGGPSRDHA